MTLLPTIEDAASELVRRRGGAAVDWLNERIRQQQDVNDMPLLDVSYRLLSAVERMLDVDGQPSSEGGFLGPGD